MKRKTILAVVLAALTIVTAGFAVGCEKQHVHTWATEWTSDGTTHWHACTTDGCDGKSDEAACTGGTATCKTKATCSVCENEYGELDANNHTKTTFVYTDNGDGTHTKKYECCGAVANANEACMGGTATCVEKATCEKCGGKYGEVSETNHAWATEWTSDGTNHWHACTRQGCDEKNDEAACTGGTATCVEKATCEVCENEYGELDANNHTKTTFVYTDNGDGTHTKKYECCGAVANANEACTGGTATCVEKATCEKCGGKYGEVDSTNHAWATEWTSDGTNHWHACTRQGCDGKGDEAVCTGGTATCVEKATCEVCENKYGEVDPDNHLYNDGYDTSDAEYDYKKCECGAVDTDKATAFKKTVNKLDRQLDMTADSVAINLNGVSEYASVKSITLVGETVSLGTDLSAIDFGDVKSDPKKHGEKTVKVVVTDNAGYDHEITVPVVLVTKMIGTADELDSVLCIASGTDTVVFGYYVLTDDITTTKNRNFVTFRGVFDGNGKTITVSTMLNGLFSYTDSATVKNLTIKAANFNPGDSNNYVTLISRNSKDTIFDTVTVIYESGTDDVKIDGRGFLFGNLGCSDVTFKDFTVRAAGKKIGALLGASAVNVKFDNCTIIADSVDCLACDANGENKVAYTDVDGKVLEGLNLVLGSQYVVLSSETPSIDLKGLAGDRTVQDIKVGTYSLGSDPTALVIPDELKTNLQSHGKTVATVTFTDGSTMEYGVILVTQEITTAAEFIKAIQIQTADKGKAKYGYYRLANDIVFTSNVNGIALTGGDSDEQSEELGFRGTLDGGDFTISTASGVKVYNGGFFGLLGKGSVVKNVKIVAAMNSGDSGLSLFAINGHSTMIQNVEVTLTEAPTNNNAGVFFAFFSGAVTCKNVTLNAEGFDLKTIFGVKIGYTNIPKCEEVQVKAKSLGAICRKGWSGDDIATLSGFTFTQTE